MQNNTLSSQVHMEHYPGQIKSWVTNQDLEKLKELKSYPLIFISLKSNQIYESRSLLQKKISAKTQTHGD